MGAKEFWGLQAIGWGLFTLVDLFDRGFLSKGVQTSLLLAVLVAPCCLLLSTGMRAAFDRLSPTNELTLRSLAVIGGLSLAAAAATTVYLSVMERLAGLTTGLTIDGVVSLIHYDIAFLGWSLCYFWIRAQLAERAEHRHALAAEAAALRAELEELRLQLDPHFLFNALNGVAEEIPDHPKAALAMLRDLTAYLRHSLAGIKQTVVAVSAEADAVAAYLRVQQARFGARLVTTMTVAPEATDRRIASFLLQPLVENAVKYGTREPVLAIDVAVRRDGEALEVEIANTGALGGPKPARARPSIGLDNVRRRLALHYPDRHRFALAERDGRVVASLTLLGEPCGS